jgi:hypothetical protein
MQQDMAQGTVRLYWPDAYCFATDATVLAVTGNALAVD